MTTESYTPDAARWDAFVEWARRFYEWEGLAEGERNYKLELGERLNKVREAFLGGEADWPEELKKALRAPYVPVFHITATRFLESGQPIIDRALRAVWASDDGEPTEPRERVRGFIESIADAPQDITPPEGLAAFLLTAHDAKQHPYYQVTPFRSAYKLTGHPPPAPDAPRWEGYAHAVGFLDEFIRQAGDRNLKTRDRLDAQSLVWCVTTKDYFVDEWPADVREALQRYRESDGDPTAEPDRDDKPPPLNAADPPAAPDWPALAARLLWEPHHLEEIVADLEDKKQMIFYGPPGTGKTYVAKAIAEEYERAGGGAEIVQFHPSYSYEDFVEGFRPSLTDDGQPAFKLVDGPLKRIAEKAEAHGDATYVLVIDELNRGNVAKVFGELYFLLEYRDEAMQLQYGGEPFQLPKNLLFICTMNTADRSIALVDAALRRRFWFEGFFPDQPPIEGLLRRYLADKQPGAEWVADLVDRANQHFADRDAAIGPSYFMGDKAELDEERVQRIWRRAVLPYVEEQCYGEAEKLEALKYDRLRSELDAAATLPAEAQAGGEAAADSAPDSDDDAPS